MIDVKTAVEKAQVFLTQFYPEIMGVQLEEIEFDDELRNWDITLSFPDSELINVPVFPRPKKYKRFIIDSETGNVLAMKIRDTK